MQRPEPVLSSTRKSPKLSSWRVVARRALHRPVGIQGDLGRQRHRVYEVRVAGRERRVEEERDRVIVAQIGAEVRRRAGRQRRDAAGHRDDLVAREHVADGDRPVVARQAHLRRARGLPGLGIERRARVHRVGQARGAPVPERFDGGRAVRRVAEDADLLLDRRADVAGPARREVVHRVDDAALPERGRRGGEEERDDGQRSHGGHGCSLRYWKTWTRRFVRVGDPDPVHRIDVNARRQPEAARILPLAAEVEQQPSLLVEDLHRLEVGVDDVEVPVTVERDALRLGRSTRGGPPGSRPGAVAAARRRTPGCES